MDLVRKPCSNSRGCEPLSVVLTHSRCPWYQNRVALMSGEYVNDSLIHCTPFLSEAAAAGSAEGSAGFLSFHELSELVQSMPGFLLLLTAEGKLLYLTDSVSEHLGHSMVNV